MRVVFVAPFRTENAELYIDRVTRVPGVDVALLTADDPARFSADLRRRFVREHRIPDALRADDIVGGVMEIEGALGPVDRLVGIVEQLQVPIAEARERLGKPGMRAAEAMNFRDKTRMKDRLREAGLPVARHRQVATAADALQFAREIGFPLIVKPPAGAASQTTYRVHDEASLRAALGPTSIASGGVVLLEEFLTGEEHSFDALVKDGAVVSYSISDYHPSCLEVADNAWIQWMVVLPRDFETADIAEAGAKALRVLGLENGMCHLEWFRRPDGTLAISEVGARPPGAQIPTMISRAHDADCIASWAKLVTVGELEPLPSRKFAAGAAYLRGQGEGRVRGVHGVDTIQRDLGHLITDMRLPVVGHEKGKSYEGEGFILVKHPETQVVRNALKHIVSTARVELG